MKVLKRSFLITNLALILSGCGPSDSSYNGVSGVSSAKIPLESRSLVIGTYYGDLISDIAKDVDLSKKDNNEQGLALYGSDDGYTQKFSLRDDTDVPWAPFPRVHQSFSQLMGSEGAISFGYDGKIFKLVKITAIANYSFGISVSKEFIISKSTIPSAVTSGNLDPYRVIKEVSLPGGGKELRPNMDGNHIIGVCFYGITSYEARRIQGGVDIVGNGVSVEKSWSDLTKISKYVRFKIYEDDSINSLVDFCQKIYPEKVKKSVKNDLATFLAGRMIDTPTTRTNEQTAINSALFGPSIKGIKAFGHKWNIYTASLNNDNGVVKVNGNIDHAIKVLRDDKITYNCAMKSSIINDPENVVDIKYKDYNIDRSYKEGAVQLVRAICQDAWLEYSQK
ncbi:MAG: hypothetical protein HQK54_06995 [Oligoflexales bacterium]|nr:hypothetical protein [Oligoflexales bacterium]